MTVTPDGWGWYPDFTHGYRLGIFCYSVDVLAVKWHAQGAKQKSGIFIVGRGSADRNMDRRYHPLRIPMNIRISMVYQQCTSSNTHAS